MADLMLALADGYGVRVLFGDMDVAARAARDLGGDGATTSACPTRRLRPLTPQIRRTRFFPELRFK